jgi:hypothetical protein
VYAYWLAPAIKFPRKTVQDHTKCAYLETGCKDDERVIKNRRFERLEGFTSLGRLETQHKYEMVDIFHKDKLGFHEEIKCWFKSILNV